MQYHYAMSANVAEAAAHDALDDIDLRWRETIECRVRELPGRPPIVHLYGARNLREACERAIVKALGDAEISAWG